VIFIHHVGVEGDVHYKPSNVHAVSKLDNLQKMLYLTVLPQWISSNRGNGDQAARTLLRDEPCLESTSAAHWWPLAAGIAATALISRIDHSLARVPATPSL
jgi:hypothetical protein